MSARIAHLSDLHYHVAPSARQALSKRALGLLNLYVKGRVSHFSAEVAGMAIQAVLAAAPDAVAITGDLTALATEAEFEAARRGLAPLLDALPTAIIPGNHDYYTRGSRDGGRIERHFGAWMRGADSGGGGEPIRYPTVHRFGDVTLLGLNPCRPHVGSSGLVRPDELERLREILAAPRRDGESRVLMIHYPLLGIDAKPIDRWTRRLNGRDALIDLLAEHPVDLVIHGHDHVRYHNRLPRAAGGVTYVVNSGSAAFAPRPGLPVPASFNIYTLDGGRVAHIEHHDLVDGAFQITYAGPVPVAGPSYNRVGDPSYGPEVVVS